MKQVFQSLGFLALTIFTVAAPRNESTIFPPPLVRLTLLFITITLFVFLLWLLIKRYRRHRMQKFSRTDSQAISSTDLIKQARANNGHLTIFQVSVRFEVESQIAEKSLNALVKAGFARRQLNEEGVLIYAVYRNFLQQNTKIFPEKNKGISTGSIN